MRIIVAMTPSGAIGKNGSIPWDLPADRRFFRNETKGSVVVMGRKTWESLVRAGVAPLPGRINVVVSRSHRAGAGAGGDGDVAWVASLDEALVLPAATVEGSHVFVIGGTELYRAALAHPSCEECVVTHVLCHVAGCDTYFPFATAYAHGWGDMRMQRCKDDDLQEENGIPFFIARYRKNGMVVEKL